MSGWRSGPRACRKVREEIRAYESKCQACVGEANRWAAELAEPRQFRVHRDGGGGGGGGGGGAGAKGGGGGARGELKVAILDLREVWCGVRDLPQAASEVWRVAWVRSPGRNDEVGRTGRAEDVRALA